MLWQQGGGEGCAGFVAKHTLTHTHARLPAAVVSMGTEISEEDKLNIHALCDQVIALSEYRAQVSALGWLLLVLRVRARVPPRPPLARASTPTPHLPSLSPTHIAPSCTTT